MLLRAGIQRLLADEDIETVAAVEDGEGLLVAVSEHRPDLAIVDVRMPPSFTDEGLRAALKAREQQPGLPVLVLSQYVEERYAVELLSGGAGGVGYLLKERVADVAEFVDAVHRVAGGGTCIDQEVIAQLMARGRRNPIDVLTPREREVLGLMAQGLTNVAIAKSLTVSDGAVEKHVGNIFSKLGLEPSAEEHRRVRAVLTFLERAESKANEAAHGARPAAPARWRQPEPGPRRPARGREPADRRQSERRRAEPVGVSYPEGERLASPCREAQLTIPASASGRESHESTPSPRIRGRPRPREQARAGSGLRPPIIQPTGAHRQSRNDRLSKPETLWTIRRLVDNPPPGHPRFNATRRPTGQRTVDNRAPPPRSDEGVGTRNQAATEAAAEAGARATSRTSRTSEVRCTSARRAPTPGRPPGPARCASAAPSS